MTSDRKNEENKFECVSCGVDTFAEQMNGPIITRHKHKDWCLLMALWRLDESVKSKPWRVAVQDLTEVCEKYAASIRAETLKEAAKIAEKHYAPMQDHVNATCGLRSVGAQLAAAIRDAGKKE